MAGQASLIFAGTTITAWPWYNLADHNLAAMDQKEIVWPHSTGRDLMNMGAERTDATSRMYSFSGRIVGSSQSALTTVTGAIETLMKAGTVGALSFHRYGDGDGESALSSYRIVPGSFRVSAHEGAVGLTGISWMAPFTVTFAHIL